MATWTFLKLDGLLCDTYANALLPAMWLLQKLGCLLCDLSESFAAGYVTYSKAWLPAFSTLWTTKKLCWWLCDLFKSLVACFVNCHKALLLAMFVTYSKVGYLLCELPKSIAACFVTHQKLGCLLFELPKSFAACFVTHWKAWLPVMLSCGEKCEQPGHQLLASAALGGHLSQPSEERPSHFQICFSQIF